MLNICSAEYLNRVFVTILRFFNDCCLYLCSQLFYLTKTKYLNRVAIKLFPFLIISNYINDYNSFV